jgi:hypothetical protein
MAVSLPDECRVGAARFVGMTERLSDLERVRARSKPKRPQRAARQDSNLRLPGSQNPVLHPQRYGGVPGAAVDAVALTLFRAGRRLEMRSAVTARS